MTSPLIETLLRRLGHRIGRSVGPQTPPDRVRALIRTLWPVETDRPLIRVGPEGDGGYLVPDQLDGIVALFSPGVGKVCGFEADCLARGMAVYMTDGSVAAPGDLGAGVSFQRRYLGPCVSEPFYTLDRWVDDSGLADGDLLLQMDIEGGEWLALAGLSRSLLQRFRVVVVEFHWLDQLWHHPFFHIAATVFTRLLAGHCCVHIHPNNHRPPSWSHELTIPTTMEFTFLRRDQCQILGPARVFPHSLDRDNTSQSTLVLPTDWYAS